MKSFKLNFKIPLVIFLLCLCFVSCNTEEENITEKSLPKDATSLEALLKNDELTVDTRLAIYYELYKTNKNSDPQIAQANIEKLITLAETTNNQVYQGKGEYAKAVLLRKGGNYQQSVIHYLKAAELFKNTGDLLRKGDASNDIGFIFLKIEGYDQAIPYFEQAAKIFETAKDWKHLSLVHSNIAVCYTKTNEYEAARASVDEARQAIEHLNKVDVNELSYLDIQKGDINYYDEKYDEAINNYIQSISYQGISNDQKLLTYYNLINAYMYKKDFKNAKNYLSKAKELKSSLELGVYMLVKTGNIEGEFYQLQGNHEKALEILNNVVAIADENIINSYYSNTLELISKSQRALANQSGKVSIDDIFKIEDLRRNQEQLKSKMADQLDFKKLQVLLDTQIQKYYRDIKQAKIDQERSTIIKIASACIAVFILTLLGTTLYIRNKKVVYETQVKKVRALFNESESDR
ncbi:tetratricopeptide repeat protein [Fulvivirga sediminis]|uniref:Tetratricopeptide repeat protein n=1 Tax=Fulvivirga sediminis TaxID=2803949 RepID=A0A937F878_9BACT|nr:tetratricopeptide repeat protein [Fulvivirga sediminis]MBL3656926.1 tetratricopeptide repeat protein [Fulvivirga sediminis]